MWKDLKKSTQVGIQNSDLVDQGSIIIWPKGR
jgi:hypothetical protein